VNAVETRFKLPKPITQSEVFACALEADYTDPQERDVIGLRVIERRLEKNLSPMEARIIRWRYGFGDGHELSLEEIGAKYNLSKERIRQIEIGALEKLRLDLNEDEAQKRRVRAATLQLRAYQPSVAPPKMKTAAELRERARMEASGEVEIPIPAGTRVIRWRPVPSAPASACIPPVRDPSAVPPPAMMSTQDLLFRCGRDDATVPEALELLYRIVQRYDGADHETSLRRAYTLVRTAALAAAKPEGSE
jgi:hypothetical protein